MRTIWKWTLRPPQTEIHMPIGAEVLTIQYQHNDAQLWALVDPRASKQHRTFRIYGTGHEMPDDPGVYLGTFQLMGGQLVFHVFEEIP